MKQTISQSDYINHTINSAAKMFLLEPSEFLSRRDHETAQARSMVIYLLMTKGIKRDALAKAIGVSRQLIYYAYRVGLRMSKGQLAAEYRDICAAIEDFQIEDANG